MNEKYKKYEIIEKVDISDTVSKFVIYAPFTARNAKAGQFLILRGKEGGERVPVTFVDWDKEAGTITIIIQAIGKSTALFNAFKQGDCFLNIAGPLGAPIDIKNYGTIAVVGGGVGIAEVYPIAKALKDAGNRVVSVIGARNKDLLILQKEMEEVSDVYVPCTDDGSVGKKGFVTDALQETIDGGEKITAGFIIGPLIMMKFVSQLMSKNGVQPYSSMNPIMVDGTGMCGCCRVNVDGKNKFACVDGPMLPSDKINFDELMKRIDEYKKEEKISLDKHNEEGGCGGKCKVGLH
ncbi:MAG: sulfide/dihydroorotate dehydrogenase-like FAD/NAD-binding protein [Elusimicrobiaceae bacterium]|jgi:NAD(P)H-flavin reductase|nr:sulfide/dihydroorotate dehydrogenase-like FAD/NAD-binding protein [Elusimicrobiaceae bacterium]MBT3955580.1 sulfide/dihydroorotate dehydrogenase-like FAD/NAD-binding protein [Elusimicrobiaceae bacterium]MBT4008657.1 sulfide/dihydroorotate dehydrogenase-like FAD/NAD-binding protein [Elusimicrobiaceae bacterium]MBT4402735.1 sulfide/dihydroorotate dehydrogenase-like FAD/NAD-binding protein [Elusimicrobiaceae bacterium]MBT5987734.1 sulfide/dihydroorotate dehydrogenase-like FAD/NAD-binding protei